MLKLFRGISRLAKFIVISLVVITSIASLIGQRVSIAKKQKEYDEIHQELLTAREENEELQRYAQENNNAEYMEEIARDKLGYAYPRERIYYITPE